MAFVIVNVVAWAPETRSPRQENVRRATFILERAGKNSDVKWEIRLLSSMKI
jgi:hypothetical protein